MKTIIFNIDGFFLEKIEGYHIPYIIRLVNGKQMKFVATRMAEYELLKKYLHYTHSYINNSCTPVIGYVITDSEAKILNYINKTHYGKGKDFQFSPGIDYIVCLEDIHNFYLFVKICYKKLLCDMTSGHNEKFGFICIDSDLHSCLPYCTQDGQKYVPLFYIEGDTDDLMQQAVILENWNLAYIKFCCKFQGIKDEFFAGDSCLAVSLDDIKNFYPPETDFMDFWPPSEATDSYPITNQKSFESNSPGSWFRVVPKVVPNQNTIPSTAPVPIIPRSTQLMNDQMVCDMYSFY